MQDPILSLIAESAKELGAARPQDPARGGVEDFVQQYAPLAQKVGQRIGVAPEALLGQWGLETGWGRSVIPGTNNLGNIKDFTGAGPQATDNMTGSRDSYRAYDSAEGFGSDFASLIERRYQAATNTGGDVGRYFTELKRGGYAEDPDYVAKGVAAARIAAQAIGSAAPAAARPADRFSGPRSEMLDPRPPAPTRTRGVFEALNDTVIEAANAASGFVGAAANFVSPGNRFSAAIDEFIQSGVEKQSDVVRAEKERLAADMEAAPDASSEVAVMGGYMLRNPALTAAQVAGSFAFPALAVKGAGAFARALGVSPAGQAGAGLGAGAAAGAAGGGGDAAGTAYELVMKSPDDVILQSPDAQALRRQGITDPAQIKEAIAQKAAAQARVLPALLGAATGVIGAERLLAGLPGAGRTRVGNALATGGIEGSTEAVEEAATVIEGQRAAAQFNPEIDPTKGAAGAATMGFVGGAGVGAVAGALQSPEMATVLDKASEPNSPLSKAAVAGTAASPPVAPVAPVDPAARLAELEAIGQQGGIFTPDQRQEYEALNSAREATPGARPDEIAPRLSAIKSALSPQVLNALRAEGSDYTAKDLLKDLAVASSKSAQPTAREQALTRIETGLQWAGANPAPMVEPNIDEITGATQGDVRQPGARPGIGQLRTGVDRDAALTARAQQAGTEFERDQINAQRKTNLEMRLGARPANSAQAVGGENRPQAVTPAEQARLEAAALGGQVDASKRQDEPRQAVIDRALRNVEERGGVASPAEAQIFAEAGLGKPYDRIDESLAPPPSTDERLTQATGIALGRRPRETVVPGRQDDAALASAEQQARSDSRLKRLADERAAAAAKRDQAQPKAPAGAPPADDVIAALKTIPALRTAEQKAVVDAARARMTAEQMRVLQDAAINPANLSATDKLQLQQMREARNSGGGAAIMSRARGLYSGWRIATQLAGMAKRWYRPHFDDLVAGGAADIDGRKLRDSSPQELLDFLRRLEPVNEHLAVHGGGQRARDLFRRAIEELEAGLREDTANKSAERRGAEPEASALTSSEPAVIRKRRRQLDKLAEDGYETVERRDGVFFIRNSRTGDEARLSGRADAALARAAVKAMVDRRANAAATSPQNDRKEPTPAQIDAVNWKKGDRFQLNGHTVVIENPAGSVRRSKPGAKVEWETKMRHHYGDLAGTRGADGDPVDVFVGPNPASPRIWVIDQLNEDGSFDEHKVLFGFDTEQQARDGYLSNYEKGWTGLGAITEMTQGEFRAWVKDREATVSPAADSEQKSAVADAPAATAPAMAVEPDRAPGTTFTVRIDNKDVEFGRADVSQLGEKESPERDGKAHRISRRSAALISAIGAALGKRVQFFDDINGTRVGDGFVKPSEPDTIYLNTVSTISPLAVFGHEFLHTLRITNPKAWDAIAAVVKTRVKNPKGFRQDYYGAEVAKKRGNRALSGGRGGELEELVSDLGGNLMADPSFWREVFAKIDADNGKDAKGIIARLIAQLQALIDMAVGAVKGPAFRAFNKDGTSPFVDDMVAVRAAFRDGLAEYLKDSGQSKAGMQAEILKSSQRQRLQGDLFPGEFATKLTSVETNIVVDSKGTRAKGGNTNSKGQQVAATKQGLQRFWNWFEGSEATDDKGRPLVLYHSTNNDFTQFETNRETTNSYGILGEVTVRRAGIFLTPDLKFSQDYLRDGDGQNVMQVYAALKRPLDLRAGLSVADEQAIETAGVSTRYVRNIQNYWELFDSADDGTNDFVDGLKRAGYDGAIFSEDSPSGESEGGTTYVAFESNQVKSATGNRGTFDPASPDITKSPERGIHFSKQQRTSINGAYYGTGLKGLEAERLAVSDDPRLKTRVYFYVDEGNGVRPEAGVGGYAHEVELPKLYDAKANAEKLWNSGDLNGTESRILDAGYAGYFVKKHETGQGFAVVIGDAAKSMPAKPIANPKIAGPISTGVPETIKAAPSSKEIPLIEVANIPGATLRAGMLRFPADSREQANAEMARIGSDLRFSKERLSTPAEEVAAVRKQYEGTDRWLKAPNGKATNLTERQWLHVRTPSFKKWFGDFEKFDGAQGGVWADDNGEVSKVVDSNGEPMVVYHGTDKGGFASFRRPGGKKRGDLGIFTTDDLAMARTYVTRGRGRILDGDEVTEEDNEGGKESGVYALFVNIRRPNEDDFGGAYWNGERTGMYMVVDDQGETVYTDGGRVYFEDRDEALALVMAKGGTIEDAPEHFNDTDSVVREAQQIKTMDGAIIRSVRDQGPGDSSYAGDPADIFVALEPSQVKSADFNDGAYSVDEDDIRRSPVRENLERVHGFEVSTREPSAKPTKDFTPEDSRRNLLISDFASGLGQSKWLAAVTELVEGYPNYRAAATTNTPEKKLERTVRQMVENLLWLHDQVPADTRNRSKLWYDGARAIAERWSRKYSISDAQAAGILAVLSPQKDWFMNVSLANRVADIMTDRQAFRWSKQMDETSARIFGAEAYQEDIEAIRGQALQDLDDAYLRAMWLRVYDQAHNPSSFYIVSPEGDFVAEARTKDGTLGRVAWGGNSTIAKAVSVFDNGSFENISAQLGRKHKVRNFYNNILVPNSPNGHVTIDTHAVAAALLRPLSGNSIEVMHNFGGPKSAHAGLDGTYALYEEAYRRAAAERGILPREMQSITWEAVRSLFLPTFKAQRRNVEAVDGVWAQFQKGRLSYENARKQVLELAGGIEAPSWAGRDPGAYVEDEPAADDGDLAADGVPAGDSAADGGDSGRRAGASARRSRARDGERGDEGRSLAPLAGAPSIAGATGPDPRLVEVAERYAASRGIQLRRQAEYVKVDPERAKRIAEAYDAMPHAPQDPAVKAAYQDLIQQTRAQYDALVGAGYKFWFMDPEADPYAGNPWNAMRDLRANQRMAVFPTAVGFGTSDFDPAANPLLADAGLEWGFGSPDGQKKRVLVNDLFRAVHDAFGHGLEGAGFRADGEENAWQAHVRLFTGPAVGAITSETRGQNSFLNYGPHGEKNRTAKVADTVFADQKTGLMPDWTWTEGRAEDAVQGPSAPPSPPADLVKIFEDMRSSPRARKSAKASAAAHPLSAKIQEIERDFLDILDELETSQVLSINCD
jgi:hypothetical protein